MKSTKSYIIFILLAFFAIVHIVSCKVSNKIASTTTSDEISNKLPKIIFFNFAIVNDTIQQEFRIQLINKIITEGTIKEKSILSKIPAIDDLEYIVLNKSSKVLQRNYIANPLNKTVEYVTNDGQLAKKNIQLNRTQFLLRIPLDPAAKFISLNRYSGQNTKSVQLFIIDIF